MNKTTENALSKVPELTLIFWIIKIAATTLGETGGDAVSMSMNLGYLVGTGIFTAFFMLAFWTSPSMRGLSLSRYAASASLFAFIAASILIFQQRTARQRP